MSSFRYGHILPLLAAVPMVIGGLMPFWDPAGAIKAFGLPDGFAASRPAQVCFLARGVVMTPLAAAIWVFYAQGKFEALDTILALMTYVGATEAYIVWKEGQTTAAMQKLVITACVGVWGFMGLTSTV